LKNIYIAVSRLLKLVPYFDADSLAVLAAWLFNSGGV